MDYFRPQPPRELEFDTDTIPSNSSALRVRGLPFGAPANDSLIGILTHRRLSPVHRNLQRIRADQVVRNHRGTFSGCACIQPSRITAAASAWMPFFARALPDRHVYIAAYFFIRRWRVVSFESGQTVWRHSLENRGYVVLNSADGICAEKRISPGLRLRDDLHAGPSDGGRIRDFARFCRCVEPARSNPSYIA